MSFLNFKARLTQKSPTADCALTHFNNNEEVRRKISCNSGSDLPQVIVGSPDSQTSDSCSSTTPTVIRNEEPTRLFVCDRRRAILEKIIDPTVVAAAAAAAAANAPHDEPPPQPNIFIADQYADSSHGNSWAFRFDFGYWNEHYIIEELCFQNFCSFLDREHGKLAMEGSPSRLDSRRGGTPQNNTMLTPPWSGDSRSPTGGPNTVGPTEGNTAYHRLPSSQSANSQEQLSVLNDEAIKSMEQLSGGRLQRLVRALTLLSPSHIVFRDHSCYPHRPTLLLFYFLKLLPYKVPRLTFDSVQSDSRINLHDVIDFDELRELTVIQPAQRSAFSVTPELFSKFLRSSTDSRKPVCISITGESAMTPVALTNFIKEWRTTPTPRLFDTISFDAASIPVVDFVHEIDGPGRSVEYERDWRPPTPPPSSGCPSPHFQCALNRQFTFKHKKGNARILYKHVDGRLVFTCTSSNAATVLPPMPRASSEQGLTHYRKNSTAAMNGRGIQRITTYNLPLAEAHQPNHDQSQTQKLVDRMFGFLLRSNA